MGDDGFLGRARGRCGGGVRRGGCSADGAAPRCGNAAGGEEGAFLSLLLVRAALLVLALKTSDVLALEARGVLGFVGGEEGQTLGLGLRGGGGGGKRVGGG